MSVFLDWFVGGHLWGLNGFHLFYVNLFSAITDKTWKKYHFTYFQKKIINFDLIISEGFVKEAEAGHLEITHQALMYFNFENQIYMLKQVLIEITTKTISVGFLKQLLVMLLIVFKVSIREHHKMKCNWQTHSGLRNSLIIANFIEHVVCYDEVHYLPYSINK